MKNPNFNLKIQFQSDLPDFSCINRYFGWYSITSQLEHIEKALYDNIVGFAMAYPDKPIIVTEYGSEAIAGLHNVGKRL